MNFNNETIAEILKEDFDKLSNTDKMHVIAACTRLLRKRLLQPKPSLPASPHA